MRYVIMMVRILALGVTVSLLPTKTIAQGQIIRPEATVSSALIAPLPTALRPVTVAEVERKAWMYTRGVLSIVTDDSARLVSGDSARRVLLARVNRWLAAVPTRSIQGLQLDALGILNASAGHQTAAFDAFNTRLAASTLTVGERGYLLAQGIEALLKFREPAVQQIVDTYMTQLDALPLEALPWKYRARTLRAEAAYNAGHLQQALIEYTKALALVHEMPFDMRGVFIMGDEEPFVRYAILMAGQPHGRARIDSTGQSLVALLTPSLALVAQDSAYVWMTQWWRTLMRQQIIQVANIGASASPIVATVWFNTSEPATTSAAAPNARVLSLADGTIRVLEIGEMGCAACLEALSVMDSLRKRLVTSESLAVDIWYVTRTVGYWGISDCTPDQEVEHLRTYYVGQHHYTLPIAVWAGPKDTAEDGSALSRESPVEKAYGIAVTPTFILVDGRGIVRHIEIGWSRPGLQRLTNFIDLLRREAAQNSSAEPIASSALNH